MSETMTTSATTASNGTQPVVSARDLTRRYGEGDTAVDALRGVSLEVRKGELTAVMDSGAIEVAVGDPSDAHVDAIEQILGRRVELVVGERSVIQDAWRYLR